jgi:hypothetical protein
MHGLKRIALILLVGLVGLPGIGAACDCDRDPCPRSAFCDHCPQYNRRPDECWSYNTEYLFATSRLLHDACNEPAACVPLIPLALAVDLATLPLTASFGLVGK